MNYREKYLVEYEIELKLLTNKKAREIIEKKLLPNLKGTVTKQIVTLENHYFDTPNRLLRKHDMGLRIRISNEYSEQTLKTSGQAVGGVYKRPEFNVALDRNRDGSELPNLGLFDSKAWPETFDLDYAQHNLKKMFSTNFSRHIYLIEDESSSIEVVCDLGEVRAANETLPICEIELELKEGTLCGLFHLAKKITSLMPTVIGVHSKAARGYGLADKINKSSPTLGSFDELVLVNSKECISLLNKALFHFQLHSAHFTFEQNLSSSTNKGILEISKALEVLSGCLKEWFNFDHCCELSELYETSLQLLSKWLSIVFHVDVETELTFELREQVSIFLSNAETIEFQLELVQVTLKKLE